jgi:hypothetical protein
MISRYKAQGIEAEFEPGSRSRVLRNLLGIRSSRAMSRVESEALLQAQDRLVDTYSRDHRFTANDICKMHRVWLGHTYIAAIHAAVATDYAPMTAIFAAVIRRSLRRFVR